MNYNLLLISTFLNLQQEAYTRFDASDLESDFNICSQNLPTHFQ